MRNELTNAEYALLGLLVEEPSHGYDLERKIDERGMREWTELAFSSIYYILKRLEKYQYLEVKSDGSTGKNTRKIHAPTKLGYQAHHRTTLKFLCDLQPVYPPILLGMANWPTLGNVQACAALRERRKSLIGLQSDLQKKTPSHPEFVAAMFDFSLGQIESELTWISRTLEKMEKPDDKPQKN